MILKKGSLSKKEATGLAIQVWLTTIGAIDIKRVMDVKRAGATVEIWPARQKG